MNVKLVPLQEQEKETFIRNIQIAFKKAVVEQFGPFDGEIIPRDHVIRSIEAEGVSYHKEIPPSIRSYSNICTRFLWTIPT